MAATVSTGTFINVSLDEDDGVPGAKLDVDCLAEYSNTQLKRWLQCRGMKVTGNRSDLLERCTACVKSGNHRRLIITVDDGKWYACKMSQAYGQRPQSSDAPVFPVLPITNWKKFPSNHIPHMFNYGHIYYFLLESIKFVNADSDSDEELDSKLSHMTAKPLKKGQQYVDSGNVVEIQDNASTRHYFVKAKVLPSMRASAPYKVTASLSAASGSVVDTSCECKASALGRCSHVAALLLAIWQHTEMGKKKGDQPTKSCTEKLCTWNTGRTTEKKPKEVHKAQYDKLSSGSRFNTINCDPRSLKKVSTDQVNKFVRDLQEDSAQTSCGRTMWETVLIPTYEEYTLTEERRETLQEQVCQLHRNLHVSGAAKVNMLPDTEMQSKSLAWGRDRWYRITASSAKTATNLGKNIQKYADRQCPPTSFSNFLNSKLWETEHVQTMWMKKGLDDEPKAREQYEKMMKTTVPGFWVKETGFWVNNEAPELGCSPDGLVTDPSEEDQDGLLEIKTLKILQCYAPSDLKTAVETGQCSRKKICSACFKLRENGTLELKKTHPYYYQIQFQLFVTERHWCDFVLYSVKGNASIERIQRDDQFINEMVHLATDLWHRVLAPEIFEMRVSRNLTPFVL